VVRHDEREWQTAGTQLSMTFPHRGMPVRMTLRLITSGYSVRDRAQSFSHPRPVFSRLFVFAKGKALVRSRGETHQLRPGRVYLLPCAQPFDVDYARSELNYYHVFAHGRTDTSIFDGLGGVPALERPDLAARLVGAYRGGNALRLMTVIAEAVGEFAEPRLDALAARMSRLDDYEELAALVRNTPPALVRIDRLAAELHRSRSALSKGFRARAGMPLKRYINQVHLQKATELLQSEERTVDAVARELGYDEPNYFYRFFRKMTGMTPGEYRRRLIAT
jgi:AraC-like DNA-binding protein